MSTALYDRLHALLGDQYLLIRELPGGGMSSLFLASERSLDRRVVIKVLPAEQAMNVSLARFQREISFMAALRHPHILPVYAGGAREEIVYYVSPYIEGESLRQRLERDRQVDADTAARILSEVADALAAAHARGIVHRDVKPENILLDDDHALLADFGVARLLAVTPTSIRTATGTAVGTPGYMAPEQIAGDPTVDARADVYALAVVGYEMLSGAPPFQGANVRALAAAHLTQPVRPLAELRPDAPAVLTSAIMRALAKDPNDRTASAAELRDSILAARNVDISAIGQLPLRQRRHRYWNRAALITSAIALVCIVAAMIVLRRGTEPSLDDDLIAVAPFGVIDPQLALWREGLVDVLAHNFDGAGSLRVVPPATAIRRWSGRADEQSAAAFGREANARLVVFGTLVRSGPDSVRLDGTLLDAANMHVLADARLFDSAERMDRLSDSLTLTFLRELGRSRPVGAVRLTGLGRTSLPALKAFLQGEQLFRHADMASARAFYERALRLDSTFALAYQRLGRVAAWENFQSDSMSALYAIRAGALNHGIAPRESLIIVADSLYGALSQGSIDSLWWTHIVRQLHTLEEAARRYPADPEIWNDLGEARVHYGPFLGVSRHDALVALQHAIALDSSFGLPYSHTIEFMLDSAGAVGARPYLRSYLSANPTGEFALMMRLTQRILDSPAVLSQRHFVDTIPSHALVEMSMYLRGWPDAAESGLQLARAAAVRRDSFMLADDNGLSAHNTLCHLLATRGHVREAARCARTEYSIVGSFDALYLELALVGVVNLDSARRTIRRSLLDGRSLPAHDAFWYAALRDTASLAILAHRCDSGAQHQTNAWARRFARYGAQSVRAYLALARLDTSGALAYFLAIPDSLRAMEWYEPLTIAQLLGARHRDRDALRILEEAPLWGVMTERDVLSALERGRVAERLGERATAASAFRFVADMWVHADPELAAHVAEAHGALDRLSPDQRGDASVSPRQNGLKAKSRSR